MTALKVCSGVLLAGEGQWQVPRSLPVAVASSTLSFLLGAWRLLLLGMGREERPSLLSHLLPCPDAPKP